MDEKTLRPLHWIGSSYRDYKSFPERVQEEMGFALFLAQAGDRHPMAKPLKGFGGAGIVELATAFDGNAFRTIYTVKFEAAVYVLHAFQKKSKSGIATPREEIELLRRRLKTAEADYEMFTGRDKEAKK